MPYFGVDIAGSAASATASNTKTHHKADYSANGSSIASAVWLVAAGDSITLAEIKGRAVDQTDPGNFSIGWYITNSAGTTQGARLAIPAVPVPCASNTVQWYASAALNYDLSAYVGQYIKASVGSDGGKVRRQQVNGVSGDMVSTAANLPTSFGTAQNESTINSIRTTITQGMPSISSVNAGAGINPGSTGNTAQLTNFGGAPTSGTFGGKSVTITGGTSSQSIFSFPGYVDGQAYPDPNGSHTLSLTYLAQTGSLASIPLNLPAGMAAVTLTAVNTIDERYIGFHVPGIADNMKIVYPTESGDFQVYPDGGVRAAETGLRELWLWNNTNSIMTRLDATINDAGEVISIVSIGLSNIVKMDDGSLSTINPIFTVGLDDLVSVLLETEGAGSYFAINVNAPDGDGSFIAKLWVNGEIAPYPGDITATASDGTNYASIECQLEIPDNYLEQIFSSPLATNTQYLPYWINSLGLGPAVNGEHIYWEFTGGNNVAPDGLVEGAMAGTFPFYYHKANHYVFVLMVTMADDGVVTNVSLVGVDGSLLTKRGITKRKLTERFLTSRKI